MAVEAPSDQEILISANEYAQFIQYQASLKSSNSPSITAIAESGNSTACLVSSSSKWVINSGATDHKSGNSTLLSNLESHASSSYVTLVDGTKFFVMGSGYVNLTPSLSVSSVLCLPNFAFNLFSVSKLTHALNCCVSFFPDHCIFQNFSTKHIIGRGRESEGLYILDQQLPRSLACSTLLTPFDVHCRLGHPSLSALKKLYPQLYSLPVLDCESCQFAKLHRLPSVSRVNKRTSSPL
ncbi:hypothetical protein MANES_02G001425v8 [Manihot esculenta]|uniref:Uncharacterized protein n=1 Tax=Manihot esculenta TaxID=3983 RepID=A0ACB7I2C0_MANES|nr:hypothetical protein MANES_02G001425v8 [Manihot esculenta]